MKKPPAIAYAIAATAALLVAGGVTLGIVNLNAAQTDAAYLAMVNQRLAEVPATRALEPTDAELITAAHAACAQLDASNGDHTATDVLGDASLYVSVRAGMHYCEEHYMPLWFTMGG